MIRIKYTTACLLICMFTCVSCDLERFPLTQFSEDSFWTSESNATLALTGIYKTNILFNAPEFSPTDWWSYGGLVFLEFPTDNAYDRRGSNSNFYKMTNGALLPSNGYVNGYWVNSYAKIARCNRFLDGVAKLSDEAVRKRLAAEARFIRASQYFYLSQFFQDVPLVTKVLTKDEANAVKKATQAEITDFIIKEFSEAAIDLPRFKDLTKDETGRASKQAVLAFLGRTCLGVKKYAEAASIYKQIMDLGDNNIDPDYRSLFLPVNENSNENIFSMQYLQDLAGNGMPQHALPVKDGGWSLVNVAAGLFEAYEFTDGTSFSYESKLYNPKNLGENRDPRLDYTIYYDGAVFKGTVYDCHPDHAESPDKIAGGQTTQTGFMLRKYLDETYSGNLNGYGGNIPIIRYAEILLSFLEAKLEAGDAITQSLLDETINKVRGRASVNMPPVKETTPALLRPILRNERRVELGMEGIRYWDLLRWGIVHEALSGYVFGAPFPGSKTTSPVPDGTVDKYGRWYVNQRAFRQDQDYKWPIPQGEQDINPNLRD